MDSEQLLTFEHEGAAMVYTRSGAGERSFILIHGIGMGHRVFQGLADELETHGTVYAVDLPGFGDSPEPGHTHSISVTGDFIAAFIRALDIRNPVMVGHSMGTQVTIECVVRHPELSDCIVLIAPTVNRAERSALRQVFRMAQDLADEDPRVLWLGLRQYTKTGPRWFLRKLHTMLEHRPEDVLPQVRARALVIRGAEDYVSPRGWTRFVADSIPRSTFREVPDHGHEAMIREAEPVASMILEHCARR